MTDDTPLTEAEEERIAALTPGYRALVEMRQPAGPAAVRAALLRAEAHERVAERTTLDRVRFPMA